jgi:alpha-1,3-mannosyl-glycoprotein beta-1,2-N-acetylglucosaminyltransferase
MTSSSKDFLLDNTAITALNHKLTDFPDGKLRGTSSYQAIKSNPLVISGRKVLEDDTVLLIISSNRPEYLKRTLSYVVQYHAPHKLPIVISEDGSSEAVAAVVRDAKAQFEVKSPGVSFEHIHHPFKQHFENGYFKLADHFRWALEKVFDERPRSQRVIVLEEDLQIAPDFFEFFAATQSFLDTDDSLLAVSAWNDNGGQKSVRDNKQLYRSDFFPGLGWMLRRSVWDELHSKWPKAYWDDWLREPAQRKGRHILRYLSSFLLIEFFFQFHCDARCCVV